MTPSSLLLALCRDLSWLSPAMGTRLALALLDLYALPDRVRFAADLALAQVVAALREHDPAARARRQWASQVIRDIVAESRKTDAQRKREAN